MKKQFISESEFLNEVEDFKKSFKEKYDQNAMIDFDKTIIRGHVSSVGIFFEDEFTIFLNKIFNARRKNSDKYKFYNDFSMNGYRPDLLIEKNGEIVALIEFKANLGYCREKAKTLHKKIDKICKESQKEISFTRFPKYIKNAEKLFTEQIKEKMKKNEENKKSITIKFNKEIGSNVKKALIVLTKDNSGKKDNLDNYKEVFKNEFYTLFSGWYYDLKNEENEIKRLYKFLEEIYNI